jgi:hypothetical protein
MNREFYKQEWCCQQCGGSGITELEVGMCPLGTQQELVRSHSLLCPGCDGNAVRCLRLRPPDWSDSDWERAKKRAKDLAVHADHSEHWMTKWRWLNWP